MIRMQNNGMLIRSAQKNYSLVKLSLMEGLPGVLIALAGAIPSILLFEGVAKWLLFLAFFLYLLAALGIMFVICSICRTFSTLIYASLATAGVFSAYSGMFTKMPEWSTALRWFQGLLPGTYFMGNITEGGHLFGALLCAAGWLLAGFGAVCVRRVTKQGK